MGEFVICVVVDVLGHVHIELLNGRGVETVAAAARDFACVRDTSQLVVLHPKVGLEDLRRGREPE